MFSAINRGMIVFQAVMISGLVIGAQEAQAQTGNVDFGTIARNITNSVEEVPGMITGLAYLIGLLMGVMGVLKIKDHVDNPEKTPLKEGAIRLTVGGAMFGLPIIYDSMLNTIGTTSALVRPSVLNRVEFNVR